MTDKNRILIVDDDINTLNNSEDILLSAGYDVSPAKSGEQAIKLLSKGVKCDLVLLDVDMPGMDGYETLSEIRKIAGCENIPIIFLTGMDAPDFEIKGLEMGAADYIVKPFIRDVLVARINSQIRKSKANDVVVAVTYNMDAINALEGKLNSTEISIAKLIADGLSNQEIADELHYSYAYVKKVTSTILSKLEMEKRSEIRAMLRM